MGKLLKLLDYLLYILSTFMLLFAILSGDTNEIITWGIFLIITKLNIMEELK